MLSPEHVALIRASAKHLALADAAVTSQFYHNLFNAAPAVRSMFPEDMFNQSEKLWASILTVVDSIDNLDAMRPALAAMGLRHIRYGAEPAHYDVVKSVLIQTIATFVGSRWTPSHTIAWDTALTFVCNEMLAGANASAA